LNPIGVSGQILSKLYLVSLRIVLYCNSALGFWIYVKFSLLAGFKLAKQRAPTYFCTCCRCVAKHICVPYVNVSKQRNTAYMRPTWQCLKAAQQKKCHRRSVGSLNLLSSFLGCKQSLSRCIIHCT
jgi:hypothetical protein